jgi:TonB family protein
MPMLKLLLLVLAVTGQQATLPRDDCTPREATRVWTSVAPPVVITRVAPRWPPAALSPSVRGVILLDVWVDEHGEVQCAKVVRSIPLGDAAAISAVRQWKFAPARIGGQSIAVVHTVAIRFPNDGV